MIFDRTQNDVNTAVNIRKNKVQNFKSLTKEEVDSLERGTITINTLNRIEQKQSELKELLTDMYYFVEDFFNKTWDCTQIFDDDEFQRIIQNEEILRKSFMVFAETPATPPISYHYKDINSLEKILYDLDRMISDVKSSYRICGDFECGGDDI